MRFLVGVVLANTANLVSAQSAYKCGNTYSQTRCPGGAQIDTSDARTAEQRSAAAKITRDSEKAVEQLANERKGREKSDLALSSEARLGIVEKPKQAKVTRSRAVPMMVKQPKAPKTAKKKMSKSSAQAVDVVKPGKLSKPPKPKKPAQSSAV